MSSLVPMKIERLVAASEAATRRVDQLDVTIPECDASCPFCWGPETD